MTAERVLTASLEDYLETIFNVIAEKEAVRPKDIAKKLNVANSSVTGALRALAEKHLINYAPHDVITLTASGRAAARDVVKRHEVLRKFFINVLAVESVEADRAACLMEHSMPKTIFDRIARFMEFVEICPRGGAEWIHKFNENCSRKKSPETCKECITQTADALKNNIEDK
jgi:DtxR family Mn-dependent transcriptional regulator